MSDASSNTDVVLTADEQIARSSDAAGNKAATLAHLREHDMPVPALVVITTAGLAAHLEYHAPTKSAELPSTPEAIAELSRIASDAPMPPALEREIVAAYEALVGAVSGHSTVAVRSSAVGEDGAHASFAGQFNSYLAVSRSDLLARVRACWASYFSVHAALYRSEMGLTASRSGMAVVVQRQLYPRKAGVLFTRHPSDDDPSLMYAEGNYGTGESVVAGLITPDTYILSRTNDTIVTQTIADKREMTVVSPGLSGSSTAGVPQDMRRRAVLDHADAASLLKLGVKLEELLGGPQDIEWAITGSKIWIVQSRPMTSRSSSSHA